MVTFFPYQPFDIDLFLCQNAQEMAVTATYIISQNAAKGLRADFMLHYIVNQNPMDMAQLSLSI